MAAPFRAYVKDINIMVSVLCHHFKVETTHNQLFVKNRLVVQT